MLLALLLAAASLPAYTDYIVDKAGILNPSDVEQLKSSCSRLDHAGIAQIAVATATEERLGDASKEEYAVSLFQKWGLGHGKKKADGVLVLMAPGKPGHRNRNGGGGANPEGSR